MPHSARPELVQFGDLTPTHFRRHRVWINCHTADHDEPWYTDTDEETFRPFTQALPAGPDTGMLLVDAEITLADGTTLDGFVTPAFAEDLARSDSGLGTMQPQLFLPSGRRQSFWFGVAGPSAQERAAFYAGLARAVSAVFPIRFRARPGLTEGACSGVIDGFYSRSRSFLRSTIVVEK